MAHPLSGNSNWLYYRIAASLLGVTKGQISRYVRDGVLEGNGAESPRARRVSARSVISLSQERQVVRRERTAFRDELAPLPPHIGEAEMFRRADDAARYSLWSEDRQETLVKLERSIRRGLRLAQFKRLLPAAKIRKLTTHLNACLELLPKG